MSPQVHACDSKDCQLVSVQSDEAKFGLQPFIARCLRSSRPLFLQVGEYPVFPFQEVDAFCDQLARMEALGPAWG